MDDLHIEPHMRFRALWQRHETLIWRRCLWAAHGRVDRAQDYFQESALRLLQHCDRLAGDQPLPERAWVVRVVKSAISHFRSTLETPFVSLDEHSLPDPVDDDDTAKLREITDDLMDCLGNDEQQFIKYYLEGFDIGELAIIFGISYTAAGTRLSRLRQKLSQQAYRKHYLR